MWRMKTNRSRDEARKGKRRENHDGDKTCTSRYRNAERVPGCHGPSSAVVVGDRAYLVDFGPGVVRQAAKAYRNGIDTLARTGW